MMRYVLVLLATMVFNMARAEDFSISGNFGLRAEGIPNALSDGKFVAVFPNLGVHFAIEAGTAEWRGGLRLSASTFFFVFCSQVDATAYVRYVFSDATSVYGGIGSRATLHFFHPSWTDWHALFGVRSSSGLFFEFMPGIATGRVFVAGTPLLTPGETASVFIASIAIGWSWNF
jgi:hypothetical protein